MKKSIKPIHDWLRPVRVAYIPGRPIPALDLWANELLEEMESMGHSMQPSPDDETEVILATAHFGEPQPWRDALLFMARRRYHLKQSPVVYTLMQIGKMQFQSMLEGLEVALSQDLINPAGPVFDGLAPDAWKVLKEQGKRGGPLLALQRILQAQAKSIRMILFVGDGDTPEFAYHFDLVGAFPRSIAGIGFYRDIALRIATAVCAEDVPAIPASDEIISAEIWDELYVPNAMEEASRQFGQRGFFSDMIRIDNLIGLPSLSDALASQYSEGCFGTWDTELGAMIVTAAGSSQPVNKSQITKEHLAVVKANGMETIGLQIDGRPYRVPSSESYEMTMMDRLLPSIEVAVGAKIPVVRSKLHGHRGISAYCADRVEYVAMDEPYFCYPVSCSTFPQAQGIVKAFSRSQTLNNPDDPRQIVFTILPGHGVFIVEKWCHGKAPFQAIWECMDAGYLETSNDIPQAMMSYVHEPDGMMRLQLLPISIETSLYD